MGSGAVIVETTNGSGTLQENLRRCDGVVRLAGEAAPTNYTSRGDLCAPAARGRERTTPQKAWVTFDGTAGSPTPADLFGVTSITKHAAGDYTINFAAGIFSNANTARWARRGAQRPPGFHLRGPVNSLPTTTAYRCRVSDAVPNYVDVNHLHRLLR